MFYVSISVRHIITILPGSVRRNFSIVTDLYLGLLFLPVITFEPQVLF
ncbi:hypothetical protein LptCag_1989 [Leptospirillum ferriphilum]|uniref:Uncharacterized protein n=1 Tax=Leptospirillum ferriphilum TaxID=178606 RepID=A0A094X7S5_9BACT|nr:hypothetical protein LptCag_1989 [Leptospirillum ferriphilum]